MEVRGQILEISPTAYQGMYKREAALETDDLGFEPETLYKMWVCQVPTKPVCEISSC